MLLQGEHLFIETLGPYKESTAGCSSWIRIVDQILLEVLEVFVQEDSIHSRTVDALFIKLPVTTFIVK